MVEKDDVTRNDPYAVVAEDIARLSESVAAGHKTLSISIRIFLSCVALVVGSGGYIVTRQPHLIRADEVEAFITERKNVFRENPYTSLDAEKDFNNSKDDTERNLALLQASGQADRSSIRVEEHQHRLKIWQAIDDNQSKIDRVNFVLEGIGRDVDRSNEIMNRIERDMDEGPSRADFETHLKEIKAHMENASPCL
jgi:hypothetical protein